MKQPDPKNDNDWITHAEYEARRDNLQHPSGYLVPEGWELDPVWGPINGAVKPVRPLRPE